MRRPIRKGDLAMVTREDLEYTDEIHAVTKVFRGRLNGFDLGRMVALDSGVALPESWVRRVLRRHSQGGSMSATTPPQK